MTKYITALGKTLGYYAYKGASNVIEITDPSTYNFNSPSQIQFANNIIISGFSYRYKIDGGAGADTITGFNANDYLIGGVGADTLIGGAGDDLLVAGKDGGVSSTVKNYQEDKLYGDAIGDLTFAAGNDIFFAAVGSTNLATTAYGDAGGTVTGGIHLGNDTFYGGFGSVTFVGDCEILRASDTEIARGGTDIFYGGDGYSSGTQIYSHLSTAFGDAAFMSGTSSSRQAIGGNDTLYSGNFVRYNMYGDANGFGYYAKGGNDTLYAGDNSTGEMSGDCRYIDNNSSEFVFGNDVLYCSRVTVDFAYISNEVFGDLMFPEGYNRTIAFGNDVIFANNGYDDLYGDTDPDRAARAGTVNYTGGADTFVFSASASGGDDIIYDFDMFNNTGDVIALLGFSDNNGAIDSWAKLEASGYLTYDADAGKTHIDVGTWHLAVNGQLTSTDFIFSFALT